jgi:hypothetical protein
VIQPTKILFSLSPAKNYKISEGGYRDITPYEKSKIDLQIDLPKKFQTSSLQSTHSTAP